LHSYGHKYSFTELLPDNFVIETQPYDHERQASAAAASHCLLQPLGVHIQQQWPIITYYNICEISFSISG